MNLALQKSFNPPSETYNLRMMVNNKQHTTVCNVCLNLVSGDAEEHCQDTYNGTIASPSTAAENYFFKTKLIEKYPNLRKKDRDILIGIQQKLKCDASNQICVNAWYSRNDIQTINLFGIFVIIESEIE